MKLIGALLVGTAAAYPKEDQIASLPGFAKLPTPQFSGTVHLADGSAAHYWLVLGPGGFETVERPLVLWAGDGRGSSVPGYFAGIGPFSLGGDGSQTSNFENGWHTAADVLFWDLPSGSGFSSCPAGAAGCPTYDDASFEAQSTEFLCEFFARYPELTNSPFFVAGEGLGGVAVPLVALGYKDVACEAHSPDLVGVAVSSACTGTEAGPCSPERAYNTFHQLTEHDFVSPLAARALDAACEGSEGFTNADAACQRAVKTASFEAGPFNLLNTESACGQNATLENFVCRVTPNASWACGDLGNATPAFGCGAVAALETYLSRADVQKALHSVQETPRNPGVFRLWRPVSRSVWVRFGYFLDG